MRPLLALLAVGCSVRTDLLSTSSDAGTGSPIFLGDECAGAAAARRLRYALCSCTALIVEHGLYPQGGSGMRGPPPAAVGSDQQIQIAGQAVLGGTLVAGGLLGVSFSRQAVVFGNVRSAGTLATAEYLSVGGDAFVGGNVFGRMDITGILHVPADAMISPGVSAKDFAFGPVSVKPPCNCGGAPDFMTALAEHAKTNDNAAIHLSPDALVSGVTSLELPSGAFYVTQIKTPPMSPLELHVHGRAALFVLGSVSLGDRLHVILESGAELDLVIGGDLTAPFGLGGGANAQLFRVWLGGTTLHVGPASLDAAIYAPNAVVLADDDLKVNGALFAAGISVPGGDISIQYETEILNAGASCGAPPESAVD